MWKLFDAYLDTNNNREIVNLYFDYIAKNTRFLFADIKYNGIDAEIDFHLEKPAAFSLELFELIKRHYKNLDLFDRYTKKANEYISEIKTVLEIDEVNSKSQIENELKRDIGKYSKLRGVNYYKVVIAFALLNCNEFLEENFSKTKLYQHV